VTGPLAVTSANRSGERTPPECEGVRDALGHAVAVYVCDGPCDGAPSTVVDLAGREPRLVREGALPSSEVLAALRA
jgi:L-threonylcarbamoyladenylate synthase